MAGGSQLLARGPAPTAPARGGNALARHPVLSAAVTAAVLHLLWWCAARQQRRRPRRAGRLGRVRPRRTPDSAYNLAWYGGMHPVSYSVVSPYVMAMLGVRTTMMLAGTVSAGAAGAAAGAQPGGRAGRWWPALFGALALTGNAVSGRVTFGLGMMFGLGAVAVVFAWPHRWRTPALRHRWPRGVAGRGPARGARDRLAARWPGCSSASWPPRCGSAGGARRRTRSGSRRWPSSRCRPGCSRSPASSRCRWARRSCPVAFGLGVFLLAPACVADGADRRGAVRRRGAGRVGGAVADRHQHDPAGPDLRRACCWWRCACATPEPRQPRPPAGLPPRPTGTCRPGARRRHHHLLDLAGRHRGARRDRHPPHRRPGPPTWPRSSTSSRPATPSAPGSRSSRRPATARRPRSRRTSTWPAAGTGRPTPSGTRSSTRTDCSPRPPTARGWTAGPCSYVVLPPRRAGPCRGRRGAAGRRRPALPAPGLVRRQLAALRGQVPHPHRRPAGRGDRLRLRRGHADRCRTPAPCWSGSPTPRG